VKDCTGLILKILKTRPAKDKFILYSLRQNWLDIMGSAAARHSSPEKIMNHTLYINTDNAAWSHNLLMLKMQILGKINSFIPLEEGKKRTFKLQDIKFFQGKIKEKIVVKEDQEPFIPKVDTTRRCPKCGVFLLPHEKLCGACQRKSINKIREKIHKILCQAPWISYSDCIQYVKCDKITFNDVKERLQDWAIWQALNPKASLKEKTFAVMLYKGLPPESLDEALVKKNLGIFKRMKQFKEE